MNSVVSIEMLREWNELLRRDLRQLYREEEIELPEWLGGPPAQQEALANLERRIGCKLPANYAAFLKLADGWPLGDPLDPTDQRLLSASEVGWLRNNDPSLIDAWASGESEAEIEVPPSIRGEADPCVFNSAHVREALLISNVVDGEALLLNPCTVDERGSWEAWILSPQAPGAWRFQSFEHLAERYFEDLKDRAAAEGYLFDDDDESHDVSWLDEPL